MLRFFRFLLKAIIILIRVFRWLQRWKHKIVSWFKGRPLGTNQYSKTTIIHPAEPSTPKRKVFGSDEGSYVEFEELKNKEFKN